MLAKKDNVALDEAAGCCNHVDHSRYTLLHALFNGNLDRFPYGIRCW